MHNKYKHNNQPKMQMEQLAGVHISVKIEVAACKQQHHLPGLFSLLT
jgi:hypothetical protein